ncbi:hypothetical protein CQ048_08155 [Pseudomonas trivialis]|nr:hypothetical protein CQ048_08155 [Pseudomonas trivialis]PRB24428.1 hypothetical protein CQ041_19250 [Pseudomonas sp. MYb60]
MRSSGACVGAGLPAMRAPRCIRNTGVMLSQASQLPHWASEALKSLSAFEASAHEGLARITGQRLGFR